MAGSSTKLRQLQITGSIDMSTATVTAITVDSTMLSASNLQQDMNNVRKLIEDIKGSTNWYDAADSDVQLADLTKHIDASNASAAAGLVLKSGIKSDTDSTDDLGASGTAFRKLYVDDIDLNGQGSISMGGGNRIDLDANDDTSVRADGADAILFEVGGVDEVVIASNLLAPSASDGAALGSTSLEWSDLYLADGAVINLGNDQDVTLTHVADTGLLLSGSTNIQLQFRDAALSINSSVDGQLDIDADTELEITAPIVDINASTSVNVSNDLKLDSDNSIFAMGADANDFTITHDGTTGATIAATTQVDITAGAASTWHASAGDLTIGGASQANAVVIKSVEATADAIDIIASAGGVEVNLGDAGGTFSMVVKDDADETQFSVNTAGAAYVQGNLQVNGDNIADSSGNAAFTFDGSANVRVNGNLEVMGTSITADVANLLVEDPIVLFGSGAASSNANGGFALASGSSTSNQALVFGRVANDVWGVGKKDVVSGEVTTLADMSLVDLRASRFQIDSANDYIDVSTDLQIIAAADILLDPAGGDVILDGNLVSQTDNTDALGANGTAWSDLFLATGAVVNFDAGDVTLTHSSNTLTLDAGSNFIATNISGSLTKLDDGTDYIIAGSGIDIVTGSSGELTISAPSGEIKRSRSFYTVTGSHANGQNLTLDTSSGKTGFTNVTAQNNPYDALDVYLNGQYMRSGTSAANGDYTVSPEFAVASGSFGAADIVFFFALENGDIVATYEHDRA
ncbi:hypothetical protein CMI47_18755 [Candidatus Pacearchaeota archaeon]|nr:hypothetical protein [Candidatus Pacearchaeota archaeon]